MLLPISMCVLETGMESGTGKDYRTIFSAGKTQVRDRDTGVYSSEHWRKSLLENSRL